MRELTDGEVERVSGANYLPQAGAVAVTYKTAYETATWFGADQLGSAIGNALYDFTNGS
ncbi:MAG: hypothetical protein WEB57_13740 [Pseudohongiellaceae bacterium]